MIIYMEYEISILLRYFCSTKLVNIMAHICPLGLRLKIYVNR